VSALRGEIHSEKCKDGTVDQKSYELFSFRWLAKALCGFNVKGCLTDVANLAFAMTGEPPRAALSESEIAARITGLGNKLRRRDFSGLCVI
jgi:hypothetical protein